VKTAIILALLAVGAAPAIAAEGTPRLETPHYRFDRATIRKGAELFALHCLSCHSLKRVRYHRLESDLGMNAATIEKEIMFPDGAEMNKGMTVTMRAEDAKQWFGAAPPDLSLEARYRGVDRIYTYLKSFYYDPSRPSGWNNRLFENVAMPNVLARLQGIKAADGSVVTPGSASPQEFDQDIQYITAWLQYAADPSKLTRTRLGPWVIAFLVVFTLLTYALKRVYWRRVH
jgi:ubiquinol-cytochrome c reductase cytochrome c1 subunit